MRRRSPKRPGVVWSGSAVNVFPEPSVMRRRKASLSAASMDETGAKPVSRAVYTQSSAPQPVTPSPEA